MRELPKFIPENCAVYYNTSDGNWWIFENGTWKTLGEALDKTIPIKLEKPRGVRKIILD